MIRLGIDTGGTYTDAVVFDTQGCQVLAKAKSLTTKSNLALGISAAVEQIPRELLSRVEHAALSTTLATNACVENKGGRAKLVLVGTTEEILHRVKAQSNFGIPYADVITTPFVGSYDGSEVTLPDWEALYASNPKFFDEADAFGIASLYALNNGAAVERDGAEFLRERFGKVVVEATTVATEPNVIERGATALLNARLVPVIEDFLDAISEAFSKQGLDVPISVVRSDGSLMSAELARLRPVETILSGPAASVMGARELVSAEESLIVDIGGTTSDVSIVHGGRPNRTDGILIGGWKTQVSGVEIDTIALGGDTVVRFTKNSRLELGTRRVTPLCVAAAQWPDVVMEWLGRHYKKTYMDFGSRHEFLYLARQPKDVSHYTQMELDLVELLQGGPVSLFDSRLDLLGSKVERLENEGLIMRCGTTPTDAMHIKGEFTTFNADASVLGARCLLKSYRGAEASEDDAEVMRIAEEIYNLARYRLYRQIAGAFMRDRYWPDDPSGPDHQLDMVLEATWASRMSDEVAPFSVNFSTGSTVVGIGAPTHVVVREVAEALGAPCATPQHAEVANAIGAAAARVAVEVEVVISPLRGTDGVTYGYQVHCAVESEHHDRINEAREAARAMAKRVALMEARNRGATEDLECSLKEDKKVYKALGAAKVIREWTVRATVL